MAKLIRCSLRGLVAFGVLGPGAALAQAPAQAPGRAELFNEPLFAPPSAPVQYERSYRWVEECRAAVRRVHDSAVWGTVQTTGDPARWQELLTANDPRQPAPPPVVETALRCGGRFPAATLADTVDQSLLQELSYAVPDSALEAVLARHLAPGPLNASPQQRAELLLAALKFALREARPARTAWVERRLEDLAHGGVDVHYVRYEGYRELVQFARNVGDTLAADRYRAAQTASWDSFPERTNPGWAAEHRYSLLEYERWRALTRGEMVEPELVFRARARAAARGQTPSPAELAKAAQSAASTTATLSTAPPINADFWFRRADSTARRPTRGKVGLVVFLEAECHIGCYTRAAQLRALHERFGDALEITLVAHTHGYFRNYSPPTPAEEAQHLARYYFEHLKLPGALAVEATPSTKLPAPDRRRVDQGPPPIIAAYLSQGLLSPASTSPFGLGAEHREDAEVLFVDHQGQVVGSGGVSWPLMPGMIAGYLAHATQSR